MAEWVVVQERAPSRETTIAVRVRRGGVEGGRWAELEGMVVGKVERGEEEEGAPLVVDEEEEELPFADPFA